MSYEHNGRRHAQSQKRMVADQQPNRLKHWHALASSKMGSTWLQKERPARSDYVLLGRWNTRGPPGGDISNNVQPSHGRRKVKVVSAKVVDRYFVILAWSIMFEQQFCMQLIERGVQIVAQILSACIMWKQERPVGHVAAFYQQADSKN